MAETEKVYMVKGHYGPDGEREVDEATGAEVVAGLTADEVRDSMVNRAAAMLALDPSFTTTARVERHVEGRVLDVTTLTWQNGEMFLEFLIDRGAASSEGEGMTRG